MKRQIMNDSKSIQEQGSDHFLNYGYQIINSNLDKEYTEFEGRLCTHFNEQLSEFSNLIDYNV
jgi:hypothetical protein